MTVHFCSGSFTESGYRVRMSNHCKRENVTMTHVTVFDSHLVIIMAQWKIRMPTLIALKMFPNRKNSDAFLLVHLYGPVVETTSFLSGVADLVELV